MWTHGHPYELVQWSPFLFLKKKKKNNNFRNLEKIRVTCVIDCDEMIYLFKMMLPIGLSLFISFFFYTYK